MRGVLHEIPRARSNGYLTDTKPGVIGISNDSGFRDDLSPKVKDTLCEEGIHVSPYNAPELEAILERRAEGALYDDAIDSGVLALCAGLAAQDTGSARQALDLLYQAGELARAADRDMITEGDVHDARSKLERSQIEHGMRKLTRHGHLSLIAVLQLAIQSTGPFRVRNIYPQYRTIAEQSDIDPLVRRRMHDHLADSRCLGFSIGHLETRGARAASTTNTALPLTSNSWRQWSATSKSWLCHGASRNSSTPWTNFWLEHSTRWGG